MKNFGNHELAAAELALKAHALRSNRSLIAQFTEGDSLIQEIAEIVNMTEAPEDAVCSLVIDLLRYCEHEKIDWEEDVMSRARARFRNVGPYAAEKKG